MNNDIVKISGSIGMVKLVKNNKNLFIFYDDHSNVSYCKNNDSIFLYEIFDKIINDNTDYIILLEEPFIRNYSNIKFLWNDIPHVVKFRNFYKKIIKQCTNIKKCKVFPVDIRLIICDVSIDELLSNLHLEEYYANYKINVYEYFKQLLYLFDYIVIDEMNVDMKFIKKIFDKFKFDDYYQKLKYQFDKLYNNFIHPNKFVEINIFLKENKKILYDLDLKGFPFENSNEDIFLDQYDKLINAIMEFYTYILLSKLSVSNVIIYCGYYHSNNLTYILKKYYNYKDVYMVGNTTDIEKKDEKNITNCLHIDKKIFN